MVLITQTKPVRRWFAFRHVPKFARNRCISTLQLVRIPLLSFLSVVFLSRTKTLIWWFWVRHVQKLDPKSCVFQRFSTYVSLFFSWSCSGRPWPFTDYFWNCKPQTDPNLWCFDASGRKYPEVSLWSTMTSVLNSRCWYLPFGSPWNEIAFIWPTRHHVSSYVSSCFLLGLALLLTRTATVCWWVLVLIDEKRA